VPSTGEFESAITDIADQKNDGIVIHDEPILIVNTKEIAARPEGNVTGSTFFDPELMAKRLAREQQRRRRPRYL
jgi:hypothetical protein